VEVLGSVVPALADLVVVELVELVMLLEQMVLQILAVAVEVVVQTQLKT
jgi:hypothetical protein